MERKRVNGVDEKCLIILSECPKCGNNEYVVEPSFKPFDKKYFLYHASCSSCGKMCGVKTLERNLIEPPEKLQAYNKINSNSHFVYILIGICIALFVGNTSLLINIFEIDIAIAGIISFGFVLNIAGISFLFYKFFCGKSCSVCKAKFTKFTHTLKANDLLSYDKGYPIDKNNNVIIQEDNLNYQVCDIWNICESCKTCQLSKMRVKSKEPIENCELKYETATKRKIIEKNNICDEPTNTTKAKKLGPNGKLTSIIQIIKTSSALTAVYTNRNIGGIILMLFGGLFIIAFCSVGFIIFQKSFSFVLLEPVTILLISFSSFLIYFLTYSILFAKIKTIIKISDDFFVARKEYTSIFFTSKIKVLCSISIDELSQLYIDHIKTEHKSSSSHSSSSRETMHSYHLKVKTKGNDKITLIKNGELYDLIELENYLEEELNIEDKIVSNKEILSKRLGNNKFSLRTLIQLIFNPDELFNSNNTGDSISSNKTALKVIAGVVGLVVFLGYYAMQIPEDFFSNPNSFRPATLTLHSQGHKKTRINNTLVKFTYLKPGQHQISFDKKKKHSIYIEPNKVTYVEFKIIDNKAIKQPSKIAQIADSGKRNFQDWELQEGSDYLAENDNHGMLIVKIKHAQLAKKISK